MLFPTRRANIDNARKSFTFVGKAQCIMLYGNSSYNGSSSSRSSSRSSESIPLNIRTIHPLWPLHLSSSAFFLRQYSMFVSNMFPGRHATVMEEGTGVGVARTREIRTRMRDRGAGRKTPLERLAAFDPCNARRPNASLMPPDFFRMKVASEGCYDPIGRRENTRSCFMPRGSCRGLLHLQYRHPPRDHSGPQRVAGAQNVKCCVHGGLYAIGE